jgi:hypothetical protein
MPPVAWPSSTTPPRPFPLGAESGAANYKQGGVARINTRGC